MSWILQPHNWGQALEKNLYNVGYRRTGIYKGMGQMGPLYSCPDGTQVFSPANCPGGTPSSAVSTDPLGLQQMQAEIDQLFNYYTQGQQAPASTGTGTTNWTPWLILGGGLFLVAMMARR